MQPLPKIVSARLQSAPRSNHPDADVLTAFAEQSLPHSERALVMEHLSRCGGCREMLALALPGMEEAAAPAVVRRPWFTLPGLSMPMLRWGAVAAALIVVASIGVIRYRQDTPKNTIALFNPPPGATLHTSESALSSSEARTKATLALSGASKPSPTVAPLARGSSMARAATSGRNETGLHALTSLPMAQGGPVLARPFAAPGANALKSLPKQSAAQESFLAQAPNPPAPVPAQTEAVEVASATVPAQQSQAESQQSLLSQQSESQSDQLSSDQSVENRAVVGKAKAATTAQTVAGLAGSSSAMGQISPVASAPRWMITPAGGLQRSYDQGKTWQDIPIAAASQPAATALQAEAAASSAQKMSRFKKQRDSSASPLFRAISASGTEIWAGAAGGILYHSVDSGDHWLSAIPSYNGILLTGDIISVQFADSLHGRLATSTSETWTTGDGGQHWSRQYFANKNPLADDYFGQAIRVSSPQISNYRSDVYRKAGRPYYPEVVWQFWGRAAEAF
jgi:hypothetical protein